MNFQLSDEHQAIREGVKSLCDRFPERYWLERDADGVFPHEFYRTMGDAGWLGTAIPEAYGGSGLGVQEAAIMMQTIAESGACLSGGSSVHINIFGLMPVTIYGTEEQKQRMLPPIAKGEVKACFGVTEPNAGLNTTRLKTRAERQCGQVFRGGGGLSGVRAGRVDTRRHGLLQRVSCRTLSARNHDSPHRPR